jgi:hypothetical protein
MDALVWALTDLMGFDVPLTFAPPVIIDQPRAFKHASRACRLAMSIRSRRSRPTSRAAPNTAQISVVRPGCQGRSNDRAPHQDWTGNRAAPPPLC